MNKEIVTEQQLKDMIQNRISSCDELDGDCRGVIVTGIYWHEPDETGSNWSVSSLRNARGCEAVVSTILSEFKQRYNLTNRRTTDS